MEKSKAYTSEKTIYVFMKQKRMELAMRHLIMNRVY